MAFQRFYIQRDFNDPREYLGCHPYEHPKPNSIFMLLFYYADLKKL
jgi:hypothetical protein